MSQAKVDDYKYHKQNRKQEMAQARRRRIVIRVIIILIIADIAAWIITSVVQSYRENKETATITVNTTAITDYLSEM